MYLPLPVFDGENPTSEWSGVSSIAVSVESGEAKGTEDSDCGVRWESICLRDGENKVAAVE